MAQIDVNQYVMQKVRNQLETDERTRDNDALLCSKIWWIEGAKDMDTQLFFERYSFTQTFTSAKAIMKCRKTLQERLVELRGPQYGKRKDHSNINQKGLW